MSPFSTTKPISRNIKPVIGKLKCSTLNFNGSNKQTNKKKRSRKEDHTIIHFMLDIDRISLFVLSTSTQGCIKSGWYIYIENNVIQFMEHCAAKLIKHGWNLLFYFQIRSIGFFCRVELLYPNEQPFYSFYS